MAPPPSAIIVIRTGWKVETMSEFLTALAVAVAAALLERLAVRIARSLWEAMQPAAG